MDKCPFFTRYGARYFHITRSPHFVLSQLHEIFLIVLELMKLILKGVKNFPKVIQSEWQDWNLNLLLQSPKPASFMYTKFGIFDTLDCPLQWRMLSSSSGLYPLNATNTSLLELWQPEMSPGAANVPGGTKLLLGKNCWFILWYFTSKFLTQTYLSN